MEKQFFKLNKEQQCFKIVKSQSKSSFSSTDNVSMSMVGQASNLKCAGENLYLKDVHYIEIPESLYNKIPCCGQYEDKQNEYLYLY